MFSRLLVSVLLASTFSISASAGSNPRPGRSEDERTRYYVATSSLTDAMLLARLGDPAFDRFARETLFIIQGRFPWEENKAVFQSLHAFIQRQLGTKHADDAAALPLIKALNHVGYFGGDEGVQYLVSLLETPDFSLSISSTNFGPRYTHARRGLLSGAVQGLGNTTSPRAHDFLVGIQKNPPPHLLNQFDPTLRDAILKIEEVTAMGMKAYSSEEHQARIQARWEKRAKEIYEKAKKKAESRDKGGKP